MLGIDVSKDTLHCALFDAHSHQLCWQREFPNNPVGHRQLLHATPPTAPWVLEPTGRYSVSVARAGQTAGRQVLLAPPRQAKDYLRSLQSRAKTDRLDSRGLALFALARPASRPLRPYPLKSVPVEHLDQLLTARKGLVQARSALQQRVGELPQAAAPLRQAVVALTAQVIELDRQIQAASRARTPPAAPPPTAAPPPPAPVAPPEEATAPPEEATAPPEEATALVFPEIPRLQKVPGIGPVIAAAVVSRLKGRVFAHPDAFVAYVGLDVGVVQSGQRKGQRGLTKQGDAELRRLLFLAVRSNLRSPKSPFKQQYERECAKGLTKTAATCAVARKLARLCWSLVKHGTDYDPARVHRPRETPAPSPRD